MVHDILVCEHTSDKSNMLNNMIQDAIEEQNIIWWNNKYRIEFLSKKWTEAQVWYTWKAMQHTDKDCGYTLTKKRWCSTVITWLYGNIEMIKFMGKQNKKNTIRGKENKEKQSIKCTRKDYDITYPLLWNLFTLRCETQKEQEITVVETWIELAKNSMK